MDLQLELFRTIIDATARDGAGFDPADTLRAVGALSGAARGKEGHDFFFGGREFPFPVALGRVILGLGGTPELLAESVAVVLGVREYDPRKVTWRRLSLEAVSAFSSMVVASDGDELWVDPQGAPTGDTSAGGSMVAGRLFSVTCGDPDLAMSAWGMRESSWGRHGVLAYRPSLDVIAERPVIDYGELRSVALWDEPFFAPTVGDIPMQIGAEQFFLQVQQVAARSTHPVRAELIAAGLVKEGQAALLLIALPNLGALSELLSGPTANNALGSRLDSVFSGCQSPYSAWSSVAARQISDEYGQGAGGLGDLESLAGATGVVLSALGGIIEGGLSSGSRAEQSYGNAVAEWIGSVFCQDPSVGAGLVRDVVSKRQAGEAVTLETREVGGMTGMVLVHLDDGNNPVREERLF